MDRHDAAQIVVAASIIGDLIEKNHPKVRNGVENWIHPDHAQPVADVITLVIAQILQSWLDAGSERDVTIEELGPQIREHIQQWVVV